jgi:hypothetical protein
VKHFKEDDIMRVAEVYNEQTGVRLSCKLKTIKLRSSAVPCIFSSYPSYLNQKPWSSRESVSDKHTHIDNCNLEKAIRESQLCNEAYTNANVFKNLNELYSILSRDKLLNRWVLEKEDGMAYFIMFSIIKNTPRIVAWVSINDSCNLKVFKDDKILKSVDNFKVPSKVNNILDLLEIFKIIENICVNGMEHSISYLKDDMLNNLISNMLESVKINVTDDVET